MPTLNRRILLVDDDAATLATYARILSLEGYNVTAVEDGRPAVALLRTQRFDLLLTDTRMPDVSGLELLAEACERTPHLPVVVYSAAGSHALEAAAYHLGAVHFSGRLWDTESLVQVVAKHLDKPKTKGSEHGLAENRIGPATRRWLSLVFGVCALDDDVRTLRDLGEELGHSERTIKRYCAICQVHAADTLNFARALRVVKRHTGRRVNWYNMLDISDPTTMTSFLVRAGLSRNAVVPDARTFLLGQQFVTNPDLLAAVTISINSWPTI